MTLSSAHPKRPQNVKSLRPGPPAVRIAAVPPPLCPPVFLWRIGVAGGLGPAMTLCCWGLTENRPPSEWHCLKERTKRTFPEGLPLTPFKDDGDGSRLRSAFHQNLNRAPAPSSPYRRGQARRVGGCRPPRHSPTTLSVPSVFEGTVVRCRRSAAAGNNAKRSQTRPLQDALLRSAVRVPSYSCV